MAMSNKTRHALKVIHDYLAGANEAVQYTLAFMADEVTETTSGMIGGIQAGEMPPSQVVTDSQPTVFNTDPAGGASTPGSLSVNLRNGHLTADWTVDGTTVNLSGVVRCIESMSGPPTDRFLFVIPQSGSGFYLWSTANI